MIPLYLLCHKWKTKKQTLQNISAACVLFNSVLDVRFSFLRGLESYLFSNNFHFVTSSPSRKNVVTVISPVSLSSFTGHGRSSPNRRSTSPYRCRTYVSLPFFMRVLQGRYYCHLGRTCADGTVVLAAIWHKRPCCSRLLDVCPSRKQDPFGPFFRHAIPES